MILGKSKVEHEVIHGCATFIPEINTRDTEASWKSVFEIDYKMEKPPEVPIRVEHIYLLDLSTTMQAKNKISQAKKALITCLKNLPKEVYFRVLGFG